GSSVNAGNIASGQVVKSLNSATDAVTITGTNGASVSTSGNTIQVSAPLAAPTGSMLLGLPNDTNLIGAGYTEIGPSLVDAWRVTAFSIAPAARAYHTAVWTGSQRTVRG